MKKCHVGGLRAGPSATSSKALSLSMIIGKISLTGYFVLSVEGRPSRRLEILKDCLSMVLAHNRSSNPFLHMNKPPTLLNDDFA
jgi:hypothetical protein